MRMKERHKLGATEYSSNQVEIFPDWFPWEMEGGHLLIFHRMIVDHLGRKADCWHPILEIPKEEGAQDSEGGGEQTSL